MTPVSQTWREALLVRLEVEKALQLLDNKRSQIHLKPVDQLRLLTLKTWSLRYYLPVREIARMLVPVLRTQIRTRKKIRGLGITAAMLTGDAAERILLQQLNKLYPNAEHIAMWRQEEKERQLRIEMDESIEGVALRFRRPLGVVFSVTPDRFVRKYKRQIRLARRRNRDREELGGRLNYRWNPNI